MKKVKFFKKKNWNISSFRNSMSWSFYYKNILKNKNNIILIDWNNYQKKVQYTLI